MSSFLNLTGGGRFLVASILIATIAELLLMVACLPIWIVIGSGPLLVGWVYGDTAGVECSLVGHLVSSLLQALLLFIGKKSELIFIKPSLSESASDNRTGLFGMTEAGKTWNVRLLLPHRSST